MLDAVQLRQLSWRAFHRLITKRKYPETLDSLMHWQWLGAGEARALHDQRLGELLRHAAANVPYYGDVLRRSGAVDGAGAVNLERFGEVPLLDKDSIRANADRLMTRDGQQRGVYFNASGGSTGAPVRLAQDRTFGAMAFTSAILFDLWTGYRMGERKVLLWGSERDLLEGRERPWIRLGRLLKNEIWLNAFRMTPTEMDAHVDTINRLRPVQIRAYAESAFDLARHIESRGLRVTAPKGISCSAGTLYPHMRETIERVFGASVFNSYGSREAGPIAAQCERGRGLHVLAPGHLVEILRPDGSAAEPGETGEVVLTVLSNYTMPLIRYRIGDMASWSTEPCPCGRCWPTLAAVHGRISDMFVSATGARVHGEYFTHLMYFRDWVRRFQVVQESVDLVRFRVVPPCGAPAPGSRDAAEMTEIEGKVRVVMGDACRVCWDFVDDIPPSASGKYRFTISLVGSSPATKA